MIEFIQSDRTVAVTGQTDERQANAYGEFSDEEEDNYDDEQIPALPVVAPKAHLSKQRVSIR